MKKVLVVVMVVILGVAMLAVVGCGGDTDTAKEYMKAADTATEAMLKKGDALDKETETMLGAAAMGDVSSIDPSEVGAVEENINLVISESQAAKMLYEKILPLEGVDTYIEYANAMIKFLDLEIKTLEAGNKLYAMIAPAFAQAFAGDYTALNAAMQQAGSELGGLNDLQKETDKAYKEAQKIKTDNNLSD